MKSWQALAAMSPEEIREKGSGRKASCRCRTPIIRKGDGLPKPPDRGIQKQEGRDLTRFDLDFDLPEHLLPEFPPAIYLTTRTDLGDVSQGQVVTLQNTSTCSTGF